MSEKARKTTSEASSLAERVRNDMQSFTPTERRAAHILLSHYPFAGLDTVAEFAARAGISAPSVLRFITRLGFGGFPEFQRHLRGELEAQLLSPLAKAGPAERGQGAPRWPHSRRRLSETFTPPWKTSPRQNSRRSSPC